MLYAGFFVMFGIAILAVWGWIASLPMSIGLYILGSVLMLIAVLSFALAAYAYQLTRTQPVEAETQKQTVEVTRHASDRARSKDPIRERQRSR